MHETRIRKANASRRLVAMTFVVALVGAACSGDDEPPRDTTASTRSTLDDSRGQTATVTVVSQNLLHGIACAPETNRCHLDDRVALFMHQLEDASCPVIVTIQEANMDTVAALRARLSDTCLGKYELVWDNDPGIDREVVLTTAPVLGSERIRLAGPLRSAYWVRIAADVGIVDLVSSHFASGSDDRPCTRSTCPPPCEPPEQINVCQGRQTVAFAERVRTEDSLVVLAGDFNARPDEPTIDAITAAGFTDTHRAAGNPECDPNTGDQCTSGRIDDAMTDMANPASRQDERIDYVFTGGNRDCRAVAPTGLFNDDPAEGTLAFPADHTGVWATMACATTTEQREAAPGATVAPATTTTVARGTAVPADDTAAITAAFENVFNGSVTDPEIKLASLEDSNEIRSLFLEQFEATKAISSRITVRIDSFSRVDDTHVDVVYTLLLDGTSPVLDHLPGGAVLIDGEWLVTKRTFCEVSTQGASEIPAPCQ